MAAEAQGLLRGGRPCFYLIIYIEARAPRPSGDSVQGFLANQQVPARFQKVPRLLHFWGNGVWPRRGVQKGTGSEQVPVGSEQVPVCLAHARCRFLQSANRLRTLSRGLCLACTRCSKLRACQAGSSRFRQKDFAFRPHQLEVPARFQKVPHVFHVAEHQVCP